ncbi:MAG: pitrilysin family protein [Bacteroidales bacterium]
MPTRPHAIRHPLLLFVLTGLLLLATTCSRPEEKFSLGYERLTLENGLEVVLHPDRSDPMVAVAMHYHVGSGREEPGKTGFAHLFEHMMFQHGAQDGPDGYIKKIQEVGGRINGATSQDGTIYYEVVPKNAIERVLWMEAGRMGSLIQDVDPLALAIQKDVVLNEKRQTVDNNPYGHNNQVIGANLFPPGHPYHGQVIGNMEDLMGATVEDVKKFHRSYYVPNNATLVLAGDFDPGEMTSLVQRYFGEIPRGEAVPAPERMPVHLKESVRLYHEDPFAVNPLLTLAWPTVEQFTPDAWALDFLAAYLGNGRNAPLHQVLVEEKQLCPRVLTYSHSMERTGMFQISLPANAGVSLDEVEKGLADAFRRFEEEGISERDLRRIKAGLETNYYAVVHSVLGKAYQMAHYAAFTGDPGFLAKEMDAIRSVRARDIRRVYDTYLRNRPFVLTSFVPKGQTDLLARDCIRATVTEEAVREALAANREVLRLEPQEPVERPAEAERLPEPALGPDPLRPSPEVWKGTLSNGMEILGTEQHELPLVSFVLEIEGGHLLDPPGKAGVAHLLCTLMLEGTAGKSARELEEAMDLLGADIRLEAGLESVRVRVTSLKRNLKQTVDLVGEILMEPRWEEEAFETTRSKALQQIRMQSGDIQSLATRSFYNLLYGETSMCALPVEGTLPSVEGIVLEDLVSYHSLCFSPSATTLKIVGDVTERETKRVFAGLSRKWTKGPGPALPAEDPAEDPVPGIYFVDQPGAKQSVFRIGNRYAPSDPMEHEAVTVANYKLGEAFHGNLNHILREVKGYSYGANSRFTRNTRSGEFLASASVRSGVTRESLEIVYEQLKRYGEPIDSADLQFTKDALLRSRACAYETHEALLEILEEIRAFDLPANYLDREQELLKSMTVAGHNALVRKHIRPDSMVYVVAGDAATQLESIAQTELGPLKLVRVD